CGETASPSSPPSPPEVCATPGIVMTVLGLPPPAGIRLIFPLSRSATSASRPGRNAIPHGTASPVATVVTFGDAAVVADGGAPAPSSAPQAAGTTMNTAAAAAAKAVRRDMPPSLPRPTLRPNPTHRDADRGPPSDRLRPWPSPVRLP